MDGFDPLKRATLALILAPLLYPLKAFAGRGYDTLEGITQTFEVIGKYDKGFVLRNSLYVPEKDIQKVTTYGLSDNDIDGTIDHFCATQTLSNEERNIFYQVIISGMIHPAGYVKTESTTGIGYDPCNADRLLIPGVCQNTIKLSIEKTIQENLIRFDNYWRSIMPKR